MTFSAQIRSLYRYPIKGLSAESLGSTRLAAGRPIAADRLYAIENGPSGFDPAAPAYFPKIRFLMLMRNESLARLDTRFDEATDRLSVRQDGREVVAGSLCTAEGRAAIEAFFAAYCAAELRGRPKILHAPGHSFSDVARKVVSIINLASVAAVESVVGATVDPIRFRANLYVEGWPAWAELDLVGRILAFTSGVRLRVVKRTERCAATDVDPRTGVRDLTLPRTLLQRLNHADCGIYCEVLSGGRLDEGARFNVEAAAD
jgi:uncharacterized protein YcbX